MEGLKKCCLIPKRYILAVMCFAAIINAYTMRNCLSLTITEMVKDAERVSETTFKWNEPQQGVILGAFYWGYIITHIPGGMIADRYGGKYTLSLGILSTAIFSFLTPIVVHTFEYYGLIVIRILEGLGEGTTFPALNVLLAHWIPIKDRAKYSCIVYTGSQIGTVIANMTTGYIIEWTGTWSAVFYFFGGMAILWFLLWQVLCFSTPLLHPYISDEELEYLQSHQAEFNKVKGPIPWHGMLTSGAVISLIIAQVGHDWVFFAMVSDLPKYMKAALSLTVAKNGLYSAIPYLVMWVTSLISGVVADAFIAKKIMSVTTCRKLFTTIGAIVPALFIICASYAGTNLVLVVTFFVLSMASMGPYYAGLKVNALDLTSNYAGVLMGLVNGLGAASGIVTPYVIGVIITQDGDIILLWRIVFWLTLAVTVASSIFYIIYAKGEEQYWNNPETYKAVRDEQIAAKQAKKDAKLAAKEEKAKIKQEKKEAKERAKQQRA